MRALLILLFGLVATPGLSQGLIRDAEIEYGLEKISEPLFEAAGLAFGGIDLFIVNSSSLNAFVLGNDIYIHAGLLQRLSRVEQVQAVIAHEIGHITGGHLAQRGARIGQTNTLAGLGLALGVAIAAGGGAGAGAGVAAGLSDAAVKDFLAFTRAQEASADQTGALILAAAGINPIAALEVFELFKGQEFVSASRRDAYVRTHPLTSQRIQYLESVAERYASLPRNGAEESRYWYERSKTKLAGFRSSPDSFLRRIDPNDSGEIATLGRAIGYFRLPDRAKSRSAMQRLLELRPDDPFYHDLNAELLLEGGNAQDAIAAYETALSYRPFDAQMLAGLGRAQLALGTDAADRDALQTLQKSYARDPRDRRMLRDLSVAFAKNGQNALASLMTAERYALGGNFREATIHAERALKQLPPGSSGALKAQDILVVAQRRR